MYAPVSPCQRLNSFFARVQHPNIVEYEGFLKMQEYFWSTHGITRLSLTCLLTDSLPPDSARTGHCTTFSNDPESFLKTS